MLVSFIWNWMLLIIFQLPHMLAESSTFLVSVLHVGSVAIDSGFKWTLMPHELQIISQPQNYLML